MNDIKIGSFTIPFWNFLILVGGLLAFLGLFFGYETFSYSYSAYGYSYGFSETISGFGLLTNDDMGSLSFFKFFPFLIALLGLLSAATVALPLFKPEPIMADQDRKFLWGGGILPLVAVLFVIIFWIFGFSDSIFSDDFYSYGTGLNYSAGIGFYFQLLGSIAALVGGVMNLKEGGHLDEYIDKAKAAKSGSDSPAPAAPAAPAPAPVAPAPEVAPAPAPVAEPAPQPASQDPFASPVNKEE